MILTIDSSSVLMATMKVVAWPNNVNQRVLDSTNITIGESGFRDNESDDKTFSERYLTSLYVPDSYSVVMDFDWAEKDTNGKSEFDRFVDWYKYVHQRGVNPFEFPSITNFTVTGSTKICQYKITSSLNPTKSGFCMRVTMTWKEVFSGGVLITEPENYMTGIDAKNGSVIASYYNSDLPSTFPTLSSSKLYYKTIEATDYTQIEITNLVRMGSQCFVSFEPLTDAGTYDIKFNDGNTNQFDRITI